MLDYYIIASTYLRRRIDDLYEWNAETKTLSICGL